MAEQLRLFVACELPDETRQALAAIATDLRKLGADSLRWVRPEGIHLTLKFLGGVDADRRPAIEQALAAAVQPFEANVRPSHVGTFGGNRLRVVWVGLDGDVDKLAGVASAVDQALEPAGFARETRPFAAHLTLARAPDHVSLDERRNLAVLVKRYQPPSLVPVVLREVSLMRSVLGSGGAVYTRLAAFPAGGALRQ
jgi:2'-5' RNA ligase